MAGPGPGGTADPDGTARHWLQTVLVIAGALVLYATSGAVAAQLTGSAVAGALVSNAVIFAAGLFLLRPVHHRAGAPQRIRRPDTVPGFWRLAVPGLLLCWLAGQAASLWLYGLLGSPNFDGHTAAKSQAPVLLTLLLVLVLAPMGEEMLMRGLVYSQLRRHTGILTAALLTTGVFSLLHLNLVQIAVTLPLGILLALVYEQTGRLSAVIALHAVFNLLSTAVPAAAVAWSASPAFVLAGWAAAGWVLFRLYGMARIRAADGNSSGPRLSGAGKV